MPSPAASSPRPGCRHWVAADDEQASFGLNEVPIGIPMPAVYVRMLPTPGARAPQQAAPSSATWQQRPFPDANLLLLHGPARG